VMVEAMSVVSQKYAGAQGTEKSITARYR